MFSKDRKRLFGCVFLLKKLRRSHPHRKHLAVLHSKTTIGRTPLQKTFGMFYLYRRPPLLCIRDLLWCLLCIGDLKRSSLMIDPLWISVNNTFGKVFSIQNSFLRYFQQRRPSEYPSKGLLTILVFIVLFSGQKIFLRSSLYWKTSRELLYKEHLLQIFFTSMAFLRLVHKSYSECPSADLLNIWNFLLAYLWTEDLFEVSLIKIKKRFLRTFLQRRGLLYKDGLLKTFVKIRAF